MPVRSSHRDKKTFFTFIKLSAERLFPVLVFLFLALPVYADEDDEKLKLAVMEFEDKSGEVSEKTLSDATEYMRNTIVSSNKYIVIAKERQEKAMISEMKKESYQSCNDKNCQIPLGQALSADTILRTTITLFGGIYTITSELIDLAKEATISGANATFDGSEKSLRIAIENIVSQIIGTKRKPPLKHGKFDERKEEWKIDNVEVAIVKFSSYPEGAVVFVDGKIICQSTPCSKMLTTGWHEIEMQKEKYLPQKKKQQVFKDEQINYTLESNFALLNVYGEDEVEIKIDGQKAGKIPIRNMAIATGTHKIEHTNPCYYNSGEIFTVKRKEKKDINLKLECRESAVKVYVQDEKGNDINAEISVDEKILGKAPGTFKIPLCSKNLTVKADGKTDYIEEISLEEKKVKEFHITMHDIYSQKEKRPQKPPKELQINYSETYHPYARTGIALMATGIPIAVTIPVTVWIFSSIFKSNKKVARYLEITAATTGGAMFVTGFILTCIKKERIVNNKVVALTELSIIPTKEGFYASTGFEF